MFSQNQIAKNWETKQPQTVIKIVLEGNEDDLDIS